MLNQSPPPDDAWPGVSVVIPTHNRPTEVAAAVRSVLRQDYPGPIEVIVVFDNEEPRPLPSPVRGSDVCRGIRNSRTRGLAGARNAGILAASHPYVAFLDDDDEWLPDRLPPQIELFQRFPKTVLVGGGILAVNDHGSFARPCPEIITHRQLLRHRVTELHASTYVVRTDALLGELGLVDEELPGSFGEDYDLVIRAAKIAPIRAVTQPVASINWAGQSFFVSTWKRNAAAIEMLMAKHNFQLEPVGQARLSGYIAYCLAASGEPREARRLARQSLRANPREKRALLAIPMSFGVVSASTLSRLAARLGYRW